MKIRSITYFIDSQIPLITEQIQYISDFNTEARHSFEASGYEVQTVRLATTPFSKITQPDDINQLIDYSQRMEAETKKAGFDYVSLGPAYPDHPEIYLMIPEVLSKTEIVFLSGHLTDENGGISIPAARACAHVIQKASTIDPDGFTNLRFAALANVPAGTPFFPAAYHFSETPSFALAMEAADLAVDIFTGSDSLENARQSLRNIIEQHALRLTEISNKLSAEFRVNFGGIDFSLAPFPLDAISFGTAMERMGVPATGQHGSLAAAAILAATLDSASFTRAGFNGLMMPVLEDSTLSARVADGNLSIVDLLLYSAVCGTGLDTLPLPGDTSADEIMPLLLDIAALAQRLDKPLTARLMPIPGKKAGDPTEFDFSFFANSRIPHLNASPLRGFLSGEETFSLVRRV